MSSLWQPVIRFLSIYGSATPKQVADGVACTYWQAGSVLSKLRARGLVEHDGFAESTGGRPPRLWALTPQGWVHAREP